MFRGAVEQEQVFGTNRSKNQDGVCNHFDRCTACLSATQPRGEIVFKMAHIPFERFSIFFFPGTDTPSLPPSATKSIEFVLAFPNNMTIVSPPVYLANEWNCSCGYNNPTGAPNCGGQVSDGNGGVRTCGKLKNTV